MLEAGISDHHSFIVTELKSQLIQSNAKMKLYRNYSSLQLETFKTI